MNHARRNILARTLAAPLILAIAGCLHTASQEDLVKKADELLPPREVKRPMDQRLQDFGRMVRAYTGLSGNVIVEIDYIANDSGISKELPSEVGYYAVSAFSRIGEPFRTTKT